MSWKATGHVLELAAKHPQLSVTQMAVLYALAARHNHEYHCAWGTIKRIAADAHVHPVTVSSTITELEDFGLLGVYEGQLPRKKSDPEDRRLTRGTLWCFVGLDPDDGPDVEGVVPRIRTGGRPATESISHRLTEFDPAENDELAGSSESVSRGLRDELAGLNSPLITGSFTGSEPESLAPQAKDKPVDDAQERAPDEAPPRRAVDEEPSAPMQLHPQVDVCTFCGSAFSGSYLEHLRTDHPLKRPPPRQVPPKLGRTLTVDELKRIEQELADYNRGRRETQATSPPSSEHGASTTSDLEVPAGG